MRSKQRILKVCTRYGLETDFIMPYYYSIYAVCFLYHTFIIITRQLADSIQDKQDNLLQTRDSLLKLAAGAPAHPAMKKRLADPYDMEVIKSQFTY